MWQTEFSVVQYEVMHPGIKHPSFKCGLLGSELGQAGKGKELGLGVDSSREVSTQHAAAVKKANFVPAIMRKRVQNKMANIAMPLDRSLVRPHLEGCVQFWLMYLKKDHTVLGKAERRETERTRVLEDLP